MKRKHTLLVIFVVLVVILSCLTVKMYIHEKWQSEQIRKLTIAQTEFLNKTAETESNLTKLEQRLTVLEDEFYSRVEYSTDGFNYLAIGNSITLHDKCDYWWNEAGMAASKPEKDYFHLVSEHLNKAYGEVNSYAFNFSIWEIQSTDRTQTITALEKYMSHKLDLITIQLSENVVMLDTFIADMKELIVFLQKECPAAKIILVDDFWSDEKSNLKKQIAEESGISFATLENIRGVTEYMCGMNTTVYGVDNTPHTVGHNGVAAHPGDKGMQAIADSITDILRDSIQQ